jgi:hypothetical protein
LQKDISKIAELLQTVDYGTHLLSFEETIDVHIFKKNRTLHYSFQLMGCMNNIKHSSILKGIDPIENLQEADD